MGSISIYSGRFGTSQVNDILEGRVVARKNKQDLELPEAIRIYPNNNKRLSGDQAFVINLKDASMDERRTFLSLWRDNNESRERSNQNLPQNRQRKRIDSSYWSVYERAIKAGASEEVAKVRAEEARVRTLQEAMGTFLGRHKRDFPGVRLQSATEFREEDSRSKKVREKASRR